MKHMISMFIAFWCTLTIVGCIGDKVLIMNRNGIYKFTDNSPSLYLLYYDDNKNEFIKTHKKIKPSTDMVIIYED